MKSLRSIVLLALFVLAVAAAWGQSTATITGIVTDPTGAVVPNAQVKIHSIATGGDRNVVTDSAGLYVAPSLQPGDYEVDATAPGFSTYKVEKLTLELDAHITLNVKLALSSAGDTVEVEGGTPLIESADITVGQVLDKDVVQDIPLNGRHFLDLTTLTPGGVTAPATGSLTAPSRGVGAFSFDTAGNREDSVNFQINGINLNDINNAQIVFQPSINTTSEVKIDNSTFSAEYGRNSGSIVNVSTRSGTNQFHGEVFDYLRNNSFDARNFFNPKGTAQIALKRNNFGGAIGGPIWKNKTFFFASYEALRQHQGLPVNTTVLTAAQQAGVTNPISKELLQFIPLPNQGTNLYAGQINGPITIDQGTIDIQNLLGTKDTIHGFYAYQLDVRTEPTVQGNTLPGFGDHRPGHRQILTVNETHVFNGHLVNELRAGYNRVAVKFINNFTSNPTTFGFNNYPAGATPTGGIPFTSISTTSIAIGGPSGFPSGRYDTLGVISDAMTYTIGRHAIKFGGEGRRYLNANFADDPGTLGFNSTATISNSGGTVIQVGQTAIQNFQQGLATSFSITPQPTTSRIYGNSIGAFAMDTFKLNQRVTFEYGFRFEWNGTPTFGNDQATFLSYTPGTPGVANGTVLLEPLVAHNPGFIDPYKQNYNYMPRGGLIVDVFGNGKTVVRGGYAILSDQPLSSVVTGLSSNPPFTTKVSYSATTTGSCTLNTSTCVPAIPISSLYASAAAASISVSAVQPNFKNATTESYNLNVQSQLPYGFTGTIGYYGSQGKHLKMSPNINQINTPVSGATTGVRNFSAISTSSPIDPGAALTGNVTQTSSIGSSNYNGMWLGIRKQTSKGVTVSFNYQWTKSMDEGSLSSGYTDITVPALNYGLSDFDTRNRISANAVYSLPFKGSRLVSGYQVAGIVQYQTGNPLNIVTTTAYTGTSGVDRPILLGKIPYAKQYVNNSVYWFAPTGASNIPGNQVCATPTAGCTFYAPSTYTGDFTGTTPLSAAMERNGATGPGFNDIDMSFSKNTAITEKVKFDLKVDLFDIFNHASFSNPGTTASTGSATFGVITATRFPVGDLGSSRQLQLSAKVTF
jgi:hypothetical protein